MFKIYSRENCPFCARTLAALKTFNIPYQEFKLEVDFSREDFLEMLEGKDHNTYPAIYHNGVFIGGFTEFKKVIF